MRIGFFTDEFLPRTDGVVTSMINLKKGLEARGHEVFVIAPSYPGYHDEPNGIIRLPSLNPLIYDNIRFPLFGRRTVSKLAEMKLDIVHSQTNFWASALAYRVAQKTGAPHVVSVHVIAPELLKDYPLQSGVVHAFSPLLFRWYYGRFATGAYRVPERVERRPFLERRGWKLLGLYVDLFDHCIVPSQHFADDLKFVGVKTPLAILPNSIDTRLYTPVTHAASDMLKIVCVGRLSGEKRQAQLIRAASRLRDDAIKFHLTLVGDGPKRRSYAALVDQLGLNKHVSFTGQLAPHDVKQFLAQADVGALVSDGFDNQPMVVLEYCASGLPILYCDPNLTEGLSADNALLCEPDSASIARGLKKLASSTKLRNSLSSASQKIAQDFDIAPQSRKVEALYQELLRGAD